MLYKQYNQNRQKNQFMSHSVTVFSVKNKANNQVVSFKFIQLNQVYVYDNLIDNQVNALIYKGLQQAV